MSKLDDLLNSSDVWDEGYGDQPIFNTDVAKQQVKDLMLELIKSCSVNTTGTSEKGLLINEAELCKKVQAL